MVDFADPANGKAAAMMALVMWACSTTRSCSMFVVFVLIVVTTYWPGRKSQIEQHGRIPLEDD